MVVEDPVELPDDAPCHLQKALDGWELSGQQGVTRSPSQKGESLEKLQKLLAFRKKEIYVVQI